MKFFQKLSTELPEEPYDSRSLFERLKEQRDKKDLEFEESHKLSKLNLDFNQTFSFLTLRSIFSCQFRKFNPWIG